MSDDKKPKKIDDEDLVAVSGGRPGGKPTTTTASFREDDIFKLSDGVNNDTLFAGPGDDSKFNLGMPGRKK